MLKILKNKRTLGITGIPEPHTRSTLLEAPTLAYKE